MSDFIDARGQACPAPVLMAKEAVERDNPAAVNILVDNEAARQNVTRFLESSKYTVESTPMESGFEITGSREGEILLGRCEIVPPETGAQKIMVMVATDRMGAGDDMLGKKLMVNFIKTLKEMGPELWRLVFVNNGVKLSIDDSPVLGELKAMTSNGTTLLVCGTCLDHFDLLDRKSVGETTNMLDIVTAMQAADKVVNV